jgi:hypothetical protein
MMKQVTTLFSDVTIEASKNFPCAENQKSRVAILLDRWVRIDRILPKIQKRYEWVPVATYTAKFFPSLLLYLRPSLPTRAFYVQNNGAMWQLYICLCFGFINR